MKTSCITHPSGDPMLVIHAWQMRACDDEPCAAMLLSLFEFYHNLKVSQQTQSKKLNEVAEAHGDMGQQYTGLLQWHSEEELQKHLLGIYGIKSIRNALQLLVNKGYISIHANPNPRYHFDRTRYILFHPEPVHDFIEQYQHPALLPDASGKNASPSGKNASPSGKNAGPITMFSPETSPMTEDPLPPDELGEEHSVAWEGDQVGGTPEPSFPAPASRAEGTNPRALGSDLRSHGLSPRQVDAQQAAAAQQAASDQVAACPHCDTKGKLLFFDAGGLGFVATCPHDLAKILAYVESHAYTWPAAPRTAQGEEHATRTHHTPDGLPHVPGAPDARGLAADPDAAGRAGPAGADHPPAGGGPDDHDNCPHGRDQPALCLQVGQAVSGAGPGGVGRPAEAHAWAAGGRPGAALTPPPSATDHGPAP
jgi:hypothetical protein